MDSYNRKNLQHIKDIFEQKTGVFLADRPHRCSIRLVLVAAAMAVCSLTMMAFSADLFSPLAGDELRLCATYEGDGLVAVYVENHSDKELRFQEQLKLMRWSTAEEITPLSSEIVFGETDFPSHTAGIMTIDLSDAYNIAALEEPLVGDHYYLVLTNHHFVFGQDWICEVAFAKPILPEEEEPTPLPPAEADTAAIGQIMEKLQPYFSYTFTDIASHQNHLSGYYATCGELLAGVQGNTVAAKSPHLYVGITPANVVFDENVSFDAQYRLVGQYRSTLDLYHIPVGSHETERALVLSADIPLHKGDTDGGAPIPLIYIMTYDTNEIESPQDYTLIRGRLMTFAALEPYKVFEDDRYVCYEVTDFFYSDLDQYVKDFVDTRGDVYFDETIRQRVQNIYTYYTDKEILREQLYYMDDSKSK